MIKKKLSQIIGKNYNDFWKFKGRYRAAKGGRASKKSTTAALWFIYHLLKYPESNLLCVRRYFTNLKDSCFAELKKAAIRLGVLDEFDFKISPLEITVKKTGQKILFRGFDNPDSITSITVSNGYLCWVWIEEAYQIDDEEAFNKLDLSIRGIPEPLFPQITITLNPWTEMWIKDRFFDVISEKILAITRNYYHNEFLTKADYELFEEIKEKDPERAKVELFGEWGQPGGRYFSEWLSSIHVAEPFEIPSDWRKYVAFDYGLDMFACYFIAVDNRQNIYVYKEIYESDLIVSEAIKRIKEFKDENEEIYAYIAPPDMWNKRQETGKSIADIFGESQIYLTKASNDRVQGWLNIKEYLKIYSDEQGILTSKIKFFKNCPNIIRCIPRLMHDEKYYNDVAKEPHEFTHAPDALRYFIASQPTSNHEKVKAPVVNFSFEKRNNSDKKINII